MVFTVWTAWTHGGHCDNLSWISKHIITGIMIGVKWSSVNHCGSAWTSVIQCEPACPAWSCVIWAEPCYSVQLVHIRRMYKTFTKWVWTGIWLPNLWIHKSKGQKRWIKLPKRTQGCLSWTYIDQCKARMIKPKSGLFYLFKYKSTGKSE